MNSPYAGLIQRYFPPEEWEHADCIQLRECPTSALNWPYCVNTNSPTSHDFGIFQVNDYWWDPTRNERSPFTWSQWQQVLDPNMNVWMASVIWQQGGWSRWSTAPLCGLQGDHGGGQIPYPNGPVVDVLPQPGPPQDGMGTTPPPGGWPVSTGAGAGAGALSIGTVFLGAGLALGLWALTRQQQQ